MEKLTHPPTKKTVRTKTTKANKPAPNNSLKEKAVNKVQEPKEIIIEVVYELAASVSKTMKRGEEYIKQVMNKSTDHAQIDARQKEIATLTILVENHRNDIGLIQEFGRKHKGVNSGRQEKKDSSFTWGATNKIEKLVSQIDSLSIDILRLNLWRIQTETAEREKQELERQAEIFKMKADKIRTQEKKRAQQKLSLETLETDIKALEWKDFQRDYFLSRKMQVEETIEKVDAITKGLENSKAIPDHEKQKFVGQAPKKLQAELNQIIQKLRELQ